MKSDSLDIVFLGLSITSSWGNGHATTYRALIRELARRGHRIQFLERDMPWYASSRDQRQLPYANIELYQSPAELRSKHSADVRKADAVIVGSYVPDGIEVGEWVISTATGLTAFYDIDTPITLARLQSGQAEYISPELVRQYRLYLSFTGGPLLRKIENEFGSMMARALYCSVDPNEYYFEQAGKKWDMGFLGTYSPDRQPALQSLLVQAAACMPGRRFAVAGAQYPGALTWPANVDRIEHLPPHEHRQFYNQQTFTLNLTRAEMIAAGHSPSVRLFEAAACAVPVISDYWEGLEDFFLPGKEILVARSTGDVLEFLRNITPAMAEEIGEAARERVLLKHTAAHRAAELESYLLESAKSPPNRTPSGTEAPIEILS